MLRYAEYKLEGNISELKSALKNAVSKKTWKDLEDEGIFFKLNTSPLTKTALYLRLQ
jgi:transcriptional regulator with AAA-type ATPase domain